jgi:NAD(P)-dependent dehydrogenase (short-subunit alcohol dehydrogenase family)
VTGKIALVTGAGSGIGQAICECLAAEGATVIVTSRTPAHVAETAHRVQQIIGREPTAIVLDLTDRAAVDAAVRQVAEQFGRIDILSNNAGIGLIRGPSLDETTDDEWDAIFGTNITGMFSVCRATLPHMHEGSSIINMASMNSLAAWRNEGAYTASKGAVLQFTRALAVDVADRDIRVNCVCPGVIDTPLTRAFLDPSDDPEALLEEYRNIAPLHRIGTAAEVASCVLFLASDEASFVTGSALVVDGGTTARL